MISKFGMISTFYFDGTYPVACSDANSFFPRDWSELRGREGRCFPRTERDRSDTDRDNLSGVAHLPVWIHVGT